MSDNRKIPPMLYAAEDVAKVLRISNTLARNYFKRGVIPTDFLVSDRRPVCTRDTLAKIDEQRQASKRR